MACVVDANLWHNEYYKAETSIFPFLSNIIGVKHTQCTCYNDHQPSKSWGSHMDKQQLLDEYFIEARSKLLDLAAFIDRVQRTSGGADFRWNSFTASLPILMDNNPEKTKRILELLSDPSQTPAEKAGGKGASGAWSGFQGGKA